MEVNKLLAVRATFTHYLHDEIYQRQVLVNNESKTVTTKSLTAIVRNANKLFPGLGNLSSRIYLAPRHKNLLIMCIEDFHKEMTFLMNYSIFDGRDWKLPTALPNNPIFNTTNPSPSNPDISKSLENITPEQIISPQQRQI